MTLVWWMGRLDAYFCEILILPKDLNEYLLWGTLRKAQDNWINPF